MNEFSQVVKWLADNESALSALAAIAVISGILYGGLRYVLTPILKHRRAQKSKLVTLSAVRAKKIKSQSEVRHSLAVMLFDTLSNNPDDEFLSSGITSEIIANVTMVPNIRVSSRLSSYRFKTGSDSIDDVAEKLNARFVLSGSLQRSEKKIRVIAQLSDIKANSEIWARTYNRDIEDLFEVQGDIARCILGTVLGEVKLAQSQTAIASPNHQLDAWGLVQKAYHFWFSSFSLQGVMDACQLLREAIEIDPEYSNAQAALAMMLSQQMATAICDDYGECAAEASLLIESAYQRSPRDIEVLENAGIAWLHLGQGRRAILALRSAIAITPLNLVARGYLALTLAITAGEQGAHEALELIKENFEIAPKHPSAPYWSFFKSMAEQRLGQHDKAIESAQLTLSDQPDYIYAHITLANSFGFLGNNRESKKAVDTAALIIPMLTMEKYSQHFLNATGSIKEAHYFVGGLQKQDFID